MLVVVALRAVQRRAEPRRRRRAGAVEQAVPARFLRVDAAFVVRHRVAVESGRDPVRVGGAVHEVAGELQDREAVERHVAVERVDHPVAVLPDLARLVEVEAAGVAVAREVEPRRRPALAVVWRRQQPVDGAFEGAGRGVGGEGVELGRRRRQADQVEARAPQQCAAIGFGERRDPGARVGGGEVAVDRVGGGGRVLRCLGGGGGQGNAAARGLGLSGGGARCGDRTADDRGLAPIPGSPARHDQTADDRAPTMTRCQRCARPRRRCEGEQHHGGEAAGRAHGRDGGHGWSRSPRWRAGATSFPTRSRGLHQGRARARGNRCSLGASARRA